MHAVSIDDGAVPDINILIYASSGSYFQLNLNGAGGREGGAVLQPHTLHN